MNCFFAYFDFLGYKEFIQRNESDYLRRRAGQILRDIEISLGQGNYQDPQHGVIYADLRRSRLNCLNISDTVLFWTNDESIESLEELIKVTYEFNWREILYNMPLRGAIYFGDVDLIQGTSVNENGGRYSVNMIFGKALVEAHLKAENQSWAGTVIDETVIAQLQQHVNPNEFLASYAIEYMVPYKRSPANQQEEFVYRLSSSPLNETAFNNTIRDIVESFERDNKDTSPERVQEIINNTNRFVELFRE